MARSDRGAAAADDTADGEAPEERRTRRPRDRTQTETQLLDAAWAILQREGVLGDVTLMKVAEEANVNRALIYRYFGSREALLLATLRRRNQETATEFEQGRQLPFVERRVHAWDQVIQDPTYGQVLAQLALSDDPEFRVMPFIEQTRAALEHDRETGALPDDVDGPVAHALSVATYLGYAVFRRALATELGVEPEELDARAGAVFEQMMTGLAHGGS